MLCRVGPRPNVHVQKRPPCMPSKTPAHGSVLNVYTETFLMHTHLAARTKQPTTPSPSLPPPPTPSHQSPHPPTSHPPTPPTTTTHINMHEHTAHTDPSTRTDPKGPNAFRLARARILVICGGPQSRSLTDRVMLFNECVPLFNHGGEEGHPLRIGGTAQMKEFTLRVDHLQQEILLGIRMVPRIDSGRQGENHKPTPIANQTNRSRQIKPRSGMSLGSPAKKAGKQWRDRSHFSESHRRRSKWDESRWRLARAVRVRVGWLTAGSRGSG